MMFSCVAGWASFHKAGDSSKYKGIKVILTWPKNLLFPLRIRQKLFLRVSAYWIISINLKTTKGENQDRSRLSFQSFKRFPSVILWGQEVLAVEGFW